MIEATETAEAPVQLGFDLSSVGSMVSAELAHDNAARLLKAAAARGMTLVLSMERSAFVDPILELHGALAAEHDNLAITLQAHLHRCAADAAAVAARGGKVRLVKGVYREPAEVALPRGPELDRRYVDLLRTLLDQGVPVAVGTQDPRLYELMEQEGLLERVVEAEMLHGVKPWLLRRLRDRGVPTRILAVYGENWWLHFLHRLAEHPRNVLVALADLDDPARIRFGAEYR
jgi:proline dehydrogenase